MYKRYETFDVDEPNRASPSSSANPHPQHYDHSSSLSEARRLGFFVGLALLLLGSYIIIWNENRLTRRETMWNTILKDAKFFDLDKMDHEQIMKEQQSQKQQESQSSVNIPVFACGTMSSYPMHDDLFRINEQGQVLIRHVEIYQWVELELLDAGGVALEYSKTWLPRLENSSNFRIVHGHENPETIMLGSVIWVEDHQFTEYPSYGFISINNETKSPSDLQSRPKIQMRVGKEYMLGDDLSHELISKYAKKLALNEADPLQLWNATYEYSDHDHFLIIHNPNRSIGYGLICSANQPCVGDLRVSFYLLNLKQVTAMGAFAEDYASIVPYIPASTQSDGIHVVGVFDGCGHNRFELVFSEEQVERNSVWPGRLFSFFLCASAYMLMFDYIHESQWLLGVSEVFTCIPGKRGFFWFGVMVGLMYTTILVLVMFVREHIGRVAAIGAAIFVAWIVRKAWP